MRRTTLVPGTTDSAGIGKFGVAPASVLLLFGCGGAQSALDIRGPAAERIADIWWAMLVIGAMVYLVVLALVLYLLRRRRVNGSGASGASTIASAADAADTSKAKRWILIGGVGLPTVVLVPLFLASVHVLSELMRRSGSDLTIHVTGHQWWWQVRYELPDANEIVAANEIHIPVGRRVRVELDAADVIHSLWIPNLHGKTDLIPGRTNVMWIEATRPGTSRAQCAEYCGTQHALMALPAVAETQAGFDEWVARERMAALPPTDSVARVGASLFVSAGCGSCHTIRGTTAGGTAGPDLTHLAGRRTIAAGTLANSPQNLARWIADPQGVKRGNKMPRTSLTADQLTAIVAFLGTLR